MSNSRVYICVIMLIALTACTKQEFAPITDPPEKDPLGKCDCDVASPEYIKANFNNTGICFNTLENAPDTFSNAYYRDSSIHLDHINLIRKNIDKTMSCQLHFINPDLHNKPLPYVLPHGEPGYNEYAEIIVSNIDQLGATNSQYDYIGNTYKLFTITITDTTGGYLKGTFQGEADTKLGRKVIIDTGIFYVHVIDVDKNE